MDFSNLNNPAMLALFKDRKDRTVKLELSVEGRPYSRKDVLGGLRAAGLEKSSVEAIGVRKKTSTGR